MAVKKGMAIEKELIKTKSDLIRMDKEMLDLRAEVKAKTEYLMVLFKLTMCFYHIQNAGQKSTEALCAMWGPVFRCKSGGYLGHPKFCFLT